MSVLTFLYRDVTGVETTRSLVTWRETSRYIQGRSATESLPKTYRKDRILQFFEGDHLLLGADAPPSPEPAPKAMPDMRPQILFTGFKAADKDRLGAVASEQGFRVMKTVGKSLSIICIGKNAGPTKVESAQGYGAFVLTEEQFFNLCRTGEVPC
ncbi:hypothetical protein LJG15_06765 [Pseudomonas aeruginosa]|uniref:BRCT domain-containing protein n=1 Tax=Pseudomonas aeruginosa TaxID=287 RepID=UPI000F533761|nr:BRCT domain-containing protein [Pseudomonas aeruginosa]MBQ9380718.1 hypothetical protein [Pseudomonas sp.]MCC0349743.1 hypothetical protein [Pseudomonas aeruginosa]NPS73352.1 hypothetical protein [Pseudomonas aeruginosa]RPS68745.1 hypothetical protein IPC991_15460 [Pseudomonas aeruginosa]HBO2545186.1 hypothetical protein [Pseudomonas aeruginosa]